ncbi:MAG TPA: hypothetical protein VMF51_06510 [Nocardioides sp.]|uniref:hypothetical protein n=1 Tax=Nocardioides sp. TaxID=35761 RepID=UPI002D140272|nr:hypothetical protein [Nocardioides sp.]HTW14762.1 hypothetical protein [Nocardioides sp.]
MTERIDWNSVVPIVHDIAIKAHDLASDVIGDRRHHISYCAIFCQDDGQYDDYVAAVAAAGTLANETATGPVYVTPGIETPAGTLRVVKVRKPDPTRPELGDADFAVDDYAAFKATFETTGQLSLIERPHFEMLELTVPGAPVRAYFSHPPVEKHPGIREVFDETA